MHLSGGEADTEVEKTDTSLFLKFKSAYDLASPPVVADDTTICINTKMTLSSGLHAVVEEAEMVSYTLAKIFGSGNCVCIIFAVPSVYLRRYFPTKFLKNMGLKVNEPTEEMFAMRIKELINDIELEYQVQRLRVFYLIGTALARVLPCRSIAPRWK